MGAKSQRKGRAGAIRILQGRCVVMKLEDWMQIYHSYRPLGDSNYKE